MENKEDVCKVSFFAHENTIVHLGNANRRMLIALITVCLTFIATIIVFVSGYTAREKNWLDTLHRLQTTEVSNGVYEQPDPGSHP